MKKLFSLVTTLIVASLIIISCKKGNNSSYSPATAAPTAVAPYGGQFQVNNQFNDNTINGNPNDSSGTAITLINTAVNVGKVSVNNDSLTFQYNNYFIPTNVITPLHGKATWHITGGNGFGAFTYTTTKSIPYFGDLHQTLTSVSKSSNVVITHALISADSIRYSIIDYNSNMATKVVHGSSTGITFTPAMMASLTTTNSATLQVTGVLTETSIQGGKNISFQNGCSYNKQGIAITN
ncbi:MAG TPA: hypothetical protein VK835_08330 [Bacteroidia bacterium]|jgi:hypothetical protein|nr:hypothetical protein [Bacteroidia bacterium]